MQPFTISILLTKEDLAAEQTRADRRVGWLTIAGLLLVAVALLLWRFSVGFPAGAVSGLVLLGLLLAAYELVLSPMLAHLGAVAQFEEQEMLRQTMTLTVSDDALLVESARVSGTLTRAELTDAAEYAALFVFTFGTQLVLRVPKRLLDEEQTRCLRDWKGR